MDTPTTRCPAPVATRHVDTEALIYRVAGMLQYTDRPFVTDILSQEGYSRETIFLVFHAALILNQDLAEFLAEA